ncbi:MAG TPA: deoxyguanosinetriphosphate triphosphohydrolase [Rhodospirillaceae bacterium]|nr:deoxyguanosinetriphosphate triphosphohydrolase [Rhodospirillaceae bacterium]
MSKPAKDQTTYNYCALPLAPYACRPDQSRGRVHKEPESRHRTPFQRDRDRIIHSSAFRRLKDKTQVFVADEGDHHRTRLTHTLEVAQITRTLARALMINEDLAESIALAHDLGHTPFAHIGEEFLNCAMKDFGGFDHNDQSLRVLTTLERRYPDWNGLNLTWETLEGVVKHNGPLKGKLHVAVSELQKKVDLGLKTHASLEAQAAALSDDIAYNNHDVEDGLRAGLFTLEDLDDVELLRESLRTVRGKYKKIEHRYIVQEMIREMFGAMVDDVLAETNKRLAKIKPQSADDIRKAGMQTVAFSNAMKGKVDELRGFLFERMYKHYTMNRIHLKVERIVGDLFQAFHRNYKVLPDHWQKAVLEAGGDRNEAARARVIADYIAGMTDRYAVKEHERLFDLYGDLR